MGGGDFSSSLAMNYHNEDLWDLLLDIPVNVLEQKSTLTYNYILTQDSGETIEEWGKDRRINFPEVNSGADIITMDTWNHAGDYGNVFCNAPFRDVLLPARKPQKNAKRIPKHTHVFRVKAPLVSPSDRICLTGMAGAMGSWEKEKAVAMEPEGEWWVSRLDLSKEEFPLTYKYAIQNVKTGELIRYEAGQNRVIEDTSKGRQVVTIYHDGFIRYAHDTWKGTGIAIPVFSLRSEKSFGVGEFTDINTLVDWATITGIRMVQLLPVNDTISSGTWQDSYPYSAISAFALHPLYLNLEKMAGKDHASVILALREKQLELNRLPDVDYEEVMRCKLNVIREIFHQSGSRTFGTKDFKAFFSDNAHWLVPYAAFSYLRDENGTADTSKWKTHSVYDAASIGKLCKPGEPHHDQISIHYFTQYHLHLQLKDAHDHANRNGIILKGDIPIGVNRHGVEAWMEPELFDLSMQSGAPPDDFAVKGQNWGFPTYNWQRMQEDGFGWWKKRFEQMSRYFDAFRIDHILGFFRIWSIPIESVDGIMGRFVPSIPVHLNEFRERSIMFDRDRYCRPFITNAVLEELFGHDYPRLRPYLQQGPDGTYSLLPEFDTQRKVETHFSGLEQNNGLAWIRSALFDLISNIILFEEEDSQGTRFHFRFQMEKTASFRHLSWETREQLKKLYIDYFFRRQDGFWEIEAMKRLPALKKSTEMLICGEDLGLVPSCVPHVMQQLGILSMEVQRMPKDPKKEFFHPNEAPYLSVVTPSSHDMSTIRGWWEEDRERIQRFYTHEMGQYSEAPRTCEPWICKTIILQHLYSPAQWSVFQFQDLMGISQSLRRADPEDERINVPANPKHYWRYRMHITLEQLMKEDDLNRELKEHIVASGRSNH
jgi:4-alpha-glucanotransferase